MAPRERSDSDRVELEGSPAVAEGLHPLSMVYGGGGVFGIGYSAGVARGLEDGGVAVATAPALGTSAGSWTAAALALGLAYDDLADIDPPSVPTRKPGALIDRARAVFGDATHPLVSASAVLVRTGRRHILDGGRYPLADLVAASSAVPGLLPPHRIEGRLYVDGGMWSTASIDAAAHAESVIVIAPLAGPNMGLMGRAAGLMLERELRGLAPPPPEPSHHPHPSQPGDGRAGRANPAEPLRRRPGPDRVPARLRAGAALGPTPADATGRMKPGGAS